MKQVVVPIALAVAALCGQSTLAAQTYTLDFGTGPTAPSLCSAVGSGIGPATLCGDGIAFNQSYGDVAGVVDVAYTEVNQTGGVPTSNSLRWWSTNYNNLYGVLYSQSSWAWIDLLPAAGKTLTLNSFLLGAWVNTTRNTNVAIFSIGSSTPLYSFVGPVGSGSGPATTFGGLNLSSSTGIRIEWRNDAFNVGIDDINFTVSGAASVVPEPGTWALMITGLGMLGVVARRRRV